MAPSANQRLPCALFVDFDNVYSHMREEDPHSAGAFAMSPAGWLRWLENGLPGKLKDGQPRTVAARFCYLNSRQFGRFAGPFQHAGFQLVDCLTLSDQGTTTAQMVMSIFDTLSGGQIGEFIVMTTKPDFAPVMNRLRHYRRRSVAIVGPSVASHYGGQCDAVLTTGEFGSLALKPIKLPEDPDAALGTMPAAARERSQPRGKQARKPQLAVITDVCNLISDLITRAPSAVSVEYLIHQVWTSRIGRDLQIANWAGYGDCATLVRHHIKQMRLAEKNGLVYDPDIHQAPTARAR
jgi:hypothetical protein